MPSDDRVDIYLPLYVRDFLTSTIGWSAEEKGHYLTLLMLQWDRGRLPAELADLERLSPGVGDVWPMLAEKFPVEADGYRRNDRLECHRDKAIELKRKRATAGKVGNQARWGDRGCDDFAIANGSQTDRNAIANGSHPPSPPPSPSPLVSSPVGEDFLPAAPVATSDPPKRRKRSQPPDAVRWDAAAGWQNISDADRQEWREAFPACDLDQELAKATSWLRANPDRARRSNWRRFLVSWLTRSQDKGGTNRTPGNRPDDKPPPTVWRDRYQAAPYRTPKEVAALAAGLKLTEEE